MTNGGDQAALSHRMPQRIYCGRNSIMAVQGIRRLTVEGGHGMDPSSVFHEYGRVGLIEGRIVGLTASGLPSTPAVDVPRLGVGQTTAG